MSRPRSKHDHVAFYACTALAVLLVGGAWVWSARVLVADGVLGAKDVFSDVSTTAGDVKAQTAPDPEAVDAIKAGFKTIISAPAAEEAERQAAVDAVAQKMRDKLAEEEAPQDGTPEETAPITE